MPDPHVADEPSTAAFGASPDGNQTERLPGADVHGSPPLRVAVTGAARGLGLAFCAEYARRGDQVTAFCRTATPALRELGVTIVDSVDVALDDSILRIREALSQPLDLLICNAGITRSVATFDELHPSDMVEEYQVNALGAVRAVLGAREALKAGAKIGLITSGGGRLDYDFPGNYGYRMSKAAMSMFGVALAEELRPKRISVRVLSPGAVDTEMMRWAWNAGLADTIDPSRWAPPDDVAAMLVRLMDELTLATSGQWVQRTGEVVFPFPHMSEGEAR